LSVVNNLVAEYFRASHLFERRIKNEFINMKLRIKSTETTLLLFGIYQIVGAIIGFCVVAWLLLHTQTVNGTVLLIYLITIGLYNLSMKAGSALIRKDYKRGLMLSMLTQSLQVIAIACAGYRYDFFSGIKLAAGFNFTDGFLFKFDFGLTSTFYMAWKSENHYYIYINVFAIFLIYILMDIYEELYQSKPVEEATAELIIEPYEETPKDGE